MKIWVEGVEEGRAGERRAPSVAEPNADGMITNRSQYLEKYTEHSWSMTLS